MRAKVKYAKIQSLLTQDVITVHVTTDSPGPSYGFECWVGDDNGRNYGEVQFGAPFGFTLLKTWEQDSVAKFPGPD